MNEHGDVSGIEFTPTFEGDGAGGMIARGMPTNSGWPQARLTYDTVCAFCGQRFKDGDRVTAQLAIPPAEGTWRHHECVEVQPRWQIRQGSWEIPSGENVFTAQRALDELNREQRDTPPDQH